MQAIRQFTVILALLTAFATASAQTCQPPTTGQLSATNVTFNSARLNCNTITGATLYQFQYRQSGSTTWTLTTSSSQNYNYITGLLAYTTYQFQCRVYCSNGWTSYSASQTFTTSSGGNSCSSPFELSCGNNFSGSNNTGNYNYTSYPFPNATGMTGPEAYHRLTVGTQALFTFTMTPQSQDLDLFLMSSCGNTSGIAFSGGSGTTTETISVNLAPGVYYIIVDGWNGYISNYNLTLSCSQASNCIAPTYDESYASDPTCTSIRLNCAAGGYNWDWAYRQLNTVNWIDLPVTSNPYYDLTGLQSSTTYEYKCSKRCSNTIWSDWSPIRQFTTPNCGQNGKKCSEPIPAYCGYTYSGNNNAGGYNFSTYYYNGQYITGESGPEVYYQFTLTTAGPLTLTLSGLTGDLDLFLLSNCNNNAVVAASGNSGTQGENILVGNLPAGTYQIVIDGWNYTTSNYNLKITCNGIIPISNDEPCYATQITSYTNCYPTDATNINATPTTNPLPPAGCAGTNNMHDVWFKVGIPASGKILVSTFPGTLGDGMIAVYAGELCTGLVNYGGCIDYNLNGDEMPDIQIVGQPGTYVYLRIWGYGGAVGTFSLCATTVNYLQTGLSIVTIGNGFAGTEDRTTIRENKEEGAGENAAILQLYPVPTNDVLYLDAHLPTEAEVRILIFNTAGQIVQEKLTSLNAAGLFETTLDVSNLPPGIFFVRLQAGDQEVTSKFIKS